MHYGFVTGLPRSGSAWIANYLYYGDCMFLHDAWKDLTPQQLKDHLVKEYEQMGFKAAGVADCGNLMIFDEIASTFPDARWVLITRPKEEVEASCELLKFPITDFTKQLQKLKTHPRLLQVTFKDMFDRADEIGRFIYPGWVCPVWRKDQLKSLNVQLHWGRVSDQFRVPDVTEIETDVTTPTKIAYYKLIREIVGDEPHAVSFLHQARGASELYRRLKEGRPINRKLALEILEAIATEWMVSPFVRNFSASIAPALVSCLEKYQNQKDLEHCPIDVELLTVVTYLFRGNEGVKEYMPRVRELSDRILKEKIT